MEIEAESVGRATVVVLHGRFDAQHVDQVKQAIQSGLKRQPHIAVDLEDVNFIDSAALAALVQGLKHCRQRSGDLVICGLQKPVRTIFELTRLDKAFTLFDSRKDAVKSLQG